MDIDVEFSFDVIGLSTDLRCYTLAWYLNKTLDIDMMKCEDIFIEFVNKQAISIINYKYATEYSQIVLLKNRSNSMGCVSSGNRILIPELLQFDYFLKIETQSDAYDIATIVDKCIKLDEIFFTQRLNIESLRSKENFIF